MFVARFSLATPWSGVAQTISYLKLSPGLIGPTEFNLLAFLHVQHLINTNVSGITNIYQEPATTKHTPSISAKKSPSPSGLNVPTETWTQDSWIKSPVLYQLSYRDKTLNRKQLTSFNWVRKLGWSMLMCSQVIRLAKMLLWIGYSNNSLRAHSSSRVI